MNRRTGVKAAWLFGGIVLVGAAIAGLQRALKFEIDFDPWDEAVHY